MSFLNAEEPSACDLVTDFGINILWHPSLGVELGANLKQLLADCISGKTKLDIFVFEGTVVNAPNGTGEWNRFAGRPMKEWVVVPKAHAKEWPALAEEALAYVGGAATKSAKKPAARSAKKSSAKRQSAKKR